MPRGPLGFPRLTSVGPLVDEEKDPNELFRDIKLRSHSYRNYNHDEFRYLLEEGINQRELREEMNVIEDGRMSGMLKSAFRFFIALDPDEKETFSNRNPGLIMWINTWAMLEDQMVYDEYE